MSDIHIQVLSFSFSQCHWISVIPHHHLHTLVVYRPSSNVPQLGHPCDVNHYLPYLHYLCTDLTVPLAINTTLINKVSAICSATTIRDILKTPDSHHNSSRDYAHQIWTRLPQSLPPLSRLQASNTIQILLLIPTRPQQPREDNL